MARKKASSSDKRELLGGWLPSEWFGDAPKPTARKKQQSQPVTPIAPKLDVTPEARLELIILHYNAIVRHLRESAKVPGGLQRLIDLCADEIFTNVGRGIWRRIPMDIENWEDLADSGKDD